MNESWGRISKGQSYNRFALRLIEWWLFIITVSLIVNTDQKKKTLILSYGNNICNRMSMSYLLLLWCTIVKRIRSACFVFEHLHESRCVTHITRKIVRRKYDPYYPVEFTKWHDKTGTRRIFHALFLF